MKQLKLTITGQVMGGKNNVGITRTGKRYPKPSWARWRDAKVIEVKQQLPKDGWSAIDGPCTVSFGYCFGDKRRRDYPAIVDAVWHVLEKAGVVTDDTHLWPAYSDRNYDKKNPRVELIIFWNP